MKKQREHSRGIDNYVYNEYCAASGGDVGEDKSRAYLAALERNLKCAGVRVPP